MAPAHRPPRVVIDTNLVLSALVFGGGRPGALRRAWQQRRVIPLVSTTTASELLRTLGYSKFRLSAGGRAHFLVTGDADLLILAEPFAPRIITAARLLESLEREA